MRFSLGSEYKSQIQKIVYSEFLIPFPTAGQIYFDKIFVGNIVEDIGWIMRSFSFGLISDLIREQNVAVYILVSQQMHFRKIRRQKINQSNSDGLIKLRAFLKQHQRLNLSSLDSQWQLSHLQILVSFSGSV